MFRSVRFLFRAIPPKALSVSLVRIEACAIFSIYINMRVRKSRGFVAKRHPFCTSKHKKSRSKSLLTACCDLGGKRGIRTPEPVLPVTRFPGVPEKFGFRRFTISYERALSDLRFICGFFILNLILIIVTAVSIRLFE